MEDEATAASGTDEETMSNSPEQAEISSDELEQSQESSQSDESVSAPEHPEESSGETDGDSDALVDGLKQSLTDDGYDVFEGRELISIRKTNQIAPNKTVSQKYFSDAEAVMLAYYDKSKEEVVIVPLPENVDDPAVYSLHTDGGQVKIAAADFLKQNGIEVEQTVRYEPEWDDNIAGDDLPGGLVIDLRQEGQTVSTSSNADQDSAAAE